MTYKVTAARRLELLLHPTAPGCYLPRLVQALSDSPDVQLTFAVGPDGRMVHVADVPSGAKCNCTCPQCGRPLHAYKGLYNRHHYHHEPLDPNSGGAGGNCDGRSAAETQAHKLAKQIIADQGKLFVPHVMASYKTRSVQVLPARWVTFDAVDVEPWKDGVRPDIVAYRDDEPLYVEPAVWHRTEAEKIAVISREEREAREAAEAKERELQKAREAAEATARVEAEREAREQLAAVRRHAEEQAQREIEERRRTEAARREAARAEQAEQAAKAKRDRDTAYQRALQGYDYLIIDDNTAEHPEFAEAKKVIDAHWQRFRDDWENNKTNLTWFGEKLTHGAVCALGMPRADEWLEGKDRRDGPVVDAVTAMPSTPEIANQYWIALLQEAHRLTVLPGLQSSGPVWIEAEATE